MRKTFTLLFSTFVLLCAFGFSSLAVAPTVAEKSPTGTNVEPTATDLVVTFDQNIKFTAEGGTLTVWEVGETNSLLKTIALVEGSTNATIVDKKLTVTHGITLVEGTTYAVTITDGIENAGGDAFGGVAEGDWEFTIGDYTAPVVKTLLPADGEANVDVKADPFNLVIEFEDASNISAVEGQKIWLYRADGTIVDLITIATGDGGNTSVSEKTATVTVDPDAFRDELTQYYVNIEEGAFVDVSDNNNKYAGLMNDTDWTFTSRDYSAPYVTNVEVTDISYETATLNVTANEAGTIWYAVVTSGAPTYPGDYTDVATGDDSAVSVALEGLNSSTKYTVYAIASNDQGNQPNPSTKGFTTLDDDAPLDIDGTNEEIAVDNVTVGVKLAFNEKVQAGTGDLLIKRDDNDQTVRTIPADQLSFTYNTTTKRGIMTARFEGLESEEDYYVVIPDGLVKDLSNNAYVSTYTNFETVKRWTFTSSDFIVPTVTVTVDESTPPVATDNILLTFSEEVKLVNETPFIDLNGLNNLVWFDYIALELNNTVVDFTASYENNIITINPVGNLLPDTTYVVKIRANTFEDTNDNAFSLTHEAIEVTTADFSDATVLLWPEDGDVDVAQGSKPTITFSKAPYIDGTSATEADLEALVTLTTDADVAVAFSVSWNAATNVLTVEPTEALASEGVYVFDFGQVKDENGVDFPNPDAVTFTMVDYTVPTVTFSHPDGTVEDKGKEENLTLTFSEDVTLSADAQNLVVFKENGPDGISLGFTASVEGNVITIDPDLNLVEGETYYYGIGGGVADDGTNTNIESFATFTFAPKAIVPGVVQVAADGYDPVIGATDVNVDASGNLVATLTFSEMVVANPAMPDANDAKLFKAGVADPVATVEIAAGDIDGSVLTVTFPAPAEGDLLVPEDQYYITIDSDVVVAADNNDKTFSGIAANEWTFNAADEIPVLTGVEPINSEVALDADVVISVTEVVNAVSGDITIAAGDADVKTIAVTSENVVIDNETGIITVSVEDYTQYNTEYTVTIPADAFEDEAGNGNVETTWKFTTKINTGATYELDPFNGQDMVAVGTSTFTITFSEDVTKGPAGTTAYLYEVVEDGDDIEIGRAYVEQGGVVVTGNVVTFDFNAALEADKDYYIVVEPDMFTDVVEPETQAVDFAGLAEGDWAFTTKDNSVPTAPTWTVTYEELGDGMVIGSDITITFDQPVDFDDEAIANDSIAKWFTLTIGDVDVRFTGTVNEDNTVIVLDNNSFSPPLTEENSENLVVLTPETGFKGIDNDLAIDNTAATFRIADYEGPEVTLGAPGDDDVEGDQFTFTVSSDEDGTIYWLVKAGAAETVTVEEVMAGTPITGYEAGDVEVVTVSDLQSETVYTVYAVAKDTIENVGELATPVGPVETSDITPPSLVEKTTTFDGDGELTLTFSENVVPGGAVAVIREAGTLEVVERVSLTGVAEGSSTILTIASTIASAYTDDAQQFIIEVEGGKVADGAGNTWDGWYGLADNAWIVSQKDETAPTLVSIDPELRRASGDDPYVIVELNSNFVLTFNEPVKLANDAQFIIYHWDSGLEVYELLEASSITVNGSEITLDPAREFVAGEIYQLTVTSNSILDLENNYYTPSITESFVGIVVDETPPVATFEPADGDIDGSQTADLKIKFSELIVLRDGSAIDKFDLETMVYFTDADGETVPHNASIGVEDGKSVITIDYTVEGDEKLDKGAQYTYGFTADFMDAAENEVPAEEATFTVVTDPVTETYIVFDPDNNDPNKATEILINQVFNIIFKGELYTHSSVISENNIAVVADYLEGVIKLNKVEREGDATVYTPVEFDAEVVTRTTEETVVSVTPKQPLLSTTAYELSVIADTLQLGVGNKTVLGFDSNDYFTEDKANPDAISYVPVDGTTAPSSTTLSVSFNEDVKKGSGTIQIKHKYGEVVLTVDANDLTINGSLVEITELTALEDGQEYFVIIPSGVITDLAGNPWEGISGEDDWNFIISQDLAAPVIKQVTPVGPNALVNTHLQITFDRSVVLNDGDTDYTGFIAIYTSVDGVAVQLIRVNDLADNTITFNEDNTVATIDIVDLEENTQYEVEVAEGTFALAGEEMQPNDSYVNAAFLRTMWTFTTEINDAPKDPILTPADDADEVELNAVASMEFDIDVQAGTGVIALRRGDDASVVHEFDVTGDEVDFSGKVVTFNLEEHLDLNTDYYIIVPAGAITNISEEPEAFAGLEQTYDWNFTTTADAYTDVTIAEVQGTGDVSPMVDELVRFTGTISAVADTGFFVQDANAEWSGIWVEAEVGEWAVGDGVTVSGTVAEVSNVTTLVAEVVVAAEAPLTVAAIELASPSAVADEKYESVLVKVSEAGTTGVDENGQFEIAYDLNDSALVNNWLYAYDVETIVTGRWYDVTGVVNGATDTYTLEPRMEADIVDVTDPTPAIIVPGDVVEFNVYPNPFVDYIKIDNMDKLSRVLVTNIAGQRVIDISYPDSDIRTAGLVSGVYVISLFTEDGMVKSDRIVKR